MRLTLLKFIQFLVIAAPAVAHSNVIFDGEDGTTGSWQIFDSTPAGATINNQTDGNSRFVALSGTDLKNAFILGGTKVRNGLGIQDQLVASWRSRANQNFRVFVALETTGGLRFLGYKPNKTALPTPGNNFRYINVGLGRQSTNGQWRYFRRDLESDLKYAQPGLEIISVNGFLVRGNVDIDDVSFTSTNDYFKPNFTIGDGPSPLKFGYNYPDAYSNPQVLDSYFDWNANEDLRLQLTGFDIDNSRAVQVSVNNTRVGTLASTPSGGTRESGLTIPASLRLANQDNHLRFDYSGADSTWGVTNISLGYLTEPNPPTTGGTTTGGNTTGGTTTGSNTGGTTDGTTTGSTTSGTTTGGGTDGTTAGGTTGGTTTGGSTGGGTTGGGSTTGSSGNQDNAFHRSGQTFLTWQESDSSVSYHVYRHNQPLTLENLGGAKRLTNRWGPLDSNTSVHRLATSDAPSRFVIEDLGEPLANDKGLFVHTTAPGEAGNAWYAVTAVNSSGEIDAFHASFGPINESVKKPQPILVRSENGGKGRIYTQFRDYANWNPTLNGYAYNFSVALPDNYNPGVQYPLQLQLHAYGEPQKFETSTEYNWPVIQLFPQDPKDSSEGIIPTWWYGYSDTHDYRNRSSMPNSGQIVNYTEQRVLDAVEFLIDDNDFNVNGNRVYAYGHSMGASGSLSMGVRYGNLFTGIYASQPMTNYGSSPKFREEIDRLWGSQSVNLPTSHRGSYAGPIARYGAGGARPTGVWDWTNHQLQLDARRGEEMAFLITDVGKRDTTIDWATQGKPLWLALTNARVGFAGVARGDAGHSWMGFAGVASNLNPLFGMQYDDNAPWRYPLNMSFISITNASDSGSLFPSNSGDDDYNQSIFWSTPWLNFDQAIIDAPNRYQVSLRSNTSNQTADITPRRTNSFTPSPGTVCGWQAIDLTDLSVISPPGAALIVDSDSLVTVEDVPILTGAGVRLEIDCS